MLYATYHRLPRPYHFPKHLTLDRLLDSNFDPGLGGFELSLYRREARDLWKGLFGPKGSRKALRGQGVKRFSLPKGWTLRLTYRSPGSRTKAGKVDAGFISPPTHRKRPAPGPERNSPGAVAQL
jgi:hypothetical protein